MHTQPHASVIQIRPGFVLDPNPGRGHEKLFQTHDAAQRELQSAIGNVLTMTSLRALVPTTTDVSKMSDDDVIEYVAHQVSLHKMSLKFSSADPGDLPWPEILKDLGRPGFEGTIYHMYLDTVGKVTVGVGTMLASVSEAQGLGFVVRKTGKPATAMEIAADFAKVGGQVKGQDASLYQTDLDLPQAEVDRVLKVRAEKFADEVAARYKGWDTYPVEVKRALIDMRYNMGGNMDKFVKFQTEIERAAQTHSGADWQKAADDSNRPQVGDVRNQWTSDMILKGGGVKK